MASQDEARARANKLGAWLGFAAATIGAAHPTTRIPSAALGTMLAIQQLHSEYDKGETVPNQPDDFGNYYGTDGVKRDAEADGKVDEITNRVINARWY